MNNANASIGWSDIVSFTRKFGFAVLLRGAVSLAVVVAALALYYACAPRKERWAQEIAVTLNQNDGRAEYPNGREFSSADLISAPVLNRVWKDSGLADKVKYESFCKWFSITGYDRERAKIDAEFQTKMSKRNITVTDLTNLQREYEAKLAVHAADNRYMLAMRPDVSLSKEDSAALIASVPATWFAVYSVINAPTMPAVMRSDVVAAYGKRLGTESARSLEMVDAVRLYINELLKTCSYLRNELLHGRNVIVNGDNLGVYEARLDLVRMEVMRFKNRLLVSGNSVDLESYVASRLDDMKCETLEAEEKAAAAKQTIELVSESSGARRGGQSEQSKDGAVALQADATFFRDFTAMIRNDANQELMKKYADELTKYRMELAEIKARQLYYDQIMEYARKATAKSAGTGTSKDADVAAFLTEILDIGEKIVAFRDQCLKHYRTPDMFYATSSPAIYAKSFTFSIARFTLGLLALWAVYNLVCLVAAWNKR